MTIEEAITECGNIVDLCEDQAKKCDLTDSYESAVAGREGECADKYRQIAEWLKELKQLREQTRWIPCSERMPEEREWIGTKKFGTTISDEVYVTLETTEGKRFCDHVRFQNGRFSLSKQAELDAIDRGIKAIAWMPLPEPYAPDINVGKMAESEE